MVGVIGNSAPTSAFRWPLRLLAALGLLLVLVTFTPLVSWWARLLAGPWNDPPGEVLVVLTGSGIDSSILGESSYWRAVYAVLVYREGRGLRKILLSGGGGENESSALAMRTFLEASAVPGGIIRTETHSRSTRESALQVTRVLRDTPGRKVLLTSDYHMFRAARAFRKAGMVFEPRPFPDAIKRATRWQGRWPAFLDLVVETAKIGYYMAHGWI
ncbi:MAG: YdcF family protein [Acidobacteriales bacterium]|nr:MAG: YdcF family protein [Terriglobales bacterium]